MQVLRNHTALHHQRRLDQAGDSGRRLQVADVGLHGAHQKGSVRFASPAVNVGHGIELDRIAHGRSGPVRLQVVDIRRQHARFGQRGFHHLLQGRRVRDREPDAGAAVIDRRALDDGPDSIAVGLGVAQALEHDDAAAFAPHVSVCRGVEGLALPVRGQHHRFGAELVNAPVEDGLHAAGDGQIRLAELQVRHGVVHRHHGRGARGVDGLGRPHQAEDE